MIDRLRVPPRLTPLAFVAAAGLLLGAHALPLSESGRYAAYLTVFSIWMAWFVATVVGLLGEPGN